jgi:hypothetical protein
MPSAAVAQKEVAVTLDEIDKVLQNPDTATLQPNPQTCTTQSSFTFKDEFSELWQLAWPICTFQFLAFLMTMVDLAMVGSLGADELAAAGLANVLFNLLNHLMAGCATAFDTLFAQTLGGGELKLYGKWLTAGTTVMIVLCIPMAAVMLSAELILVGLHQDPVLAERAGQFCKLLVPGLVPLYCFLALTRYLQVVLTNRSPKPVCCYFALPKPDAQTGSKDLAAINSDRDHSQPLERSSQLRAHLRTVRTRVRWRGDRDHLIEVGAACADDGVSLVR